MRISDWSSDVSSSDLPQIDQVVYILRDDGSLTRAEGNVRMQRDDADGLHVTADNIPFASAPGVPPKVRHEIIRIGPGTACQRKDCGTPAMMSAFRWNGRHLAPPANQLRRSLGKESVRARVR